MKNFLPAFAAALFASILTVVALGFLRSDSPTATASAALPAGEVALAGNPGSYESLEPGSMRGPGYGELLQELEMRMISLEDRFALVADGRKAVTLEGEGLDDASLAGPESRDFVLDVLAQKEEDERLQREEERRQRAQERLLEKADKIAAELGLGTGDRDKLLSVLTEESERRGVFMETARETGWGPENRDQMRTAMQAIADWKTAELDSRFGPALTEQIGTWEQENERGRGRGGMGGGGNTGRGGGGGGQRGGGR